MLRRFLSRRILIEQAGIPECTLKRRFKAATGLTPGQYRRMFKPAINATQP